MKIKKKHDIRYTIIISIVVIILAYLLVLFKPPITGLIVLEQNWDSNQANYIYNESLVNVSNGEIRLLPITNYYNWSEKNSSKIYVSSAVYNGDDKTSKIVTLDGEKVKVNKNKIFNVVFNSELNNGDIISLYLINSDANDIYLCNIDDNCTSPGFGLVNYNGNSGWYNITITNLNNPINGFNIDPVEVKFDYIEAIHFITLEYNSTNISWQATSVETGDINFDEEINSIIFYYNSKNVNYQYSIDSGNNWQDILQNNLNLDNINKIRFKINLIDNNSIVYSFGFNYTANISNNYVIGNSGYVTAIANENVTINSGDFILTLMTNKTINNALISFNNSNQTSSLNKIKDIKIDNNINNNLISANIKIYYTDEEINNAGLDEDKLKIGYYDENNNTWVMIDSIVNKEENYVSVNVNHFSIYGLFGEEKTSGGSSTSSGSGSSSEAGGRGEIKSKINATESESLKKVTPIQEVKKEEVKNVTITETKPEFTAAGKVVYSKNSVIKYTKENIWFISMIIIIIVIYLALRFFFLNKHRREFHKLDE